MNRVGAPFASLAKPLLTAAVALAVISVGVFGCGDDSTASGGTGDHTSTGGRGTGGKGGKGGKGGTGGTSKAGGAGGKPTSGGAGGSGATDASSETGGAGPVDSGSGGSSPVPDAGPPDAGASLCGNNRIDPPEQCDDGNSLDEDDCTSACTDNHACSNCIASNCPFDATNQPKCSDFPDAKSKDACYRTYACLVRTQCFLQSDPASTDAASCVPSALYCYCGTADTVTCKDGNGTGPCKDVIDAAFADAPGDLPVVDSNAIVNNFGDVLAPAGAALNVLQCAHDYCGCPSFGGNWDCSPSHHAGGKDAQ